MRLYRLTLATILQRKVWIIAVLCLALLPMVLPYLTPHDTNPGLIEPARAQAAWICLWVVTIAWGFFQAAGFGHSTVQSGMGAYFRSNGVSAISQLMQIWLACMTYLLPFVLITFLVSVLGAMPGAASQKGMWVVMNLQSAGLLILAMSPLVMMAVAVGSRFGGTIGYLVPFCLSIYGVYGVGYMAMMTEVRESAFLDFLYVVSPHYHLADLTPRMVFKHGSMLAPEYLELVGYFVVLKVVITLFSALCIKTRPVA